MFGREGRHPKASNIALVLLVSSSHCSSLRPTSLKPAPLQRPLWLKKGRRLIMIGELTVTIHRVPAALLFARIEHIRVVPAEAGSPLALRPEGLIFPLNLRPLPAPTTRQFCCCRNAQLSSTASLPSCPTTSSQTFTALLSSAACSPLRGCLVVRTAHRPSRSIPITIAVTAFSLRVLAVSPHSQKVTERAQRTFAYQHATVVATPPLLPHNINLKTKPPFDHKQLCLAWTHRTI